MKQARRRRKIPPQDPSTSASVDRPPRVGRGIHELLPRERKFRNRERPDVVGIWRGRIGIPRQENLGFPIDDWIALVFETRDVLHAWELLAAFGITPCHFPRAGQRDGVLDSNLRLKCFVIGLADALDDM